MKKFLLGGFLTTLLFSAALYLSHDFIIWGNSVQELEKLENTKMTHYSSWSNLHFAPTMDSKRRVWCGLVTTRWVYDGKGNGWEYLRVMQWKVIPIFTQLNEDNMPESRTWISQQLGDFCYRLEWWTEHYESDKN